MRRRFFRVHMDDDLAEWNPAIRTLDGRAADITRGGSVWIAPFFTNCENFGPEPATGDDLDATVSRELIRDATIRGLRMAGLAAVYLRVEAGLTWTEISECVGLTRSWCRELAQRTRELLGDSFDFRLADLETYLAESADDSDSANLSAAGLDDGDNLPGGAADDETVPEPAAAWIREFIPRCDSPARRDPTPAPANVIPGLYRHGLAALYFNSEGLSWREVAALISRDVAHTFRLAGKAREVLAAELADRFPDDKAAA